MELLTVSRALHVAVGLVHLAPSAGALSAARARRAYGLAPGGPNDDALLRHRAGLLGIVGGGLVAGAVRPELRPLSTAAGAASMLGYLAVLATTPGTGVPLRRVAAVDAVALVALGAAAVIDQRASRS